MHVPSKFIHLTYVTSQRLKGDNIAVVTRYKPGNVVILGSH